MIDEITNDKIIHGGILTEINVETGEPYTSTYLNKELNFKNKLF